jgi:hypothetical protein
VTKAAVRAFVEREDAATKEDADSNEKGIEEPVTPVPERVFRGGRLPGPRSAAQ